MKYTGILNLIYEAAYGYNLNLILSGAHGFQDGNITGRGNVSEPWRWEYEHKEFKFFERLLKVLKSEVARTNAINRQEIRIDYKPAYLKGIKAGQNAAVRVCLKQGYKIRPDWIEEMKKEK